MEKDGPKDFFVSYNKADREWAEWIAWQLEESGYTTVLQAWDFLAGATSSSTWTQPPNKLHHRASSRQTISTSKFTRAEWAAAFANDPTGEQGLLLSVRVRPCD